ncbi:MAG: HAD family hydrolase [Lentisphaeria bacterium]
MNKAVFLDRDGTVIVDRGYLDDAEKVELIPGAAEAMLKLRRAGYKLVLITNQSGIGRGYFDREAVERQHDRLTELLAQKEVRLDFIGICPHAPDENCECRKPNPGLLLKAAADLNIELGESYMIGDKESDIEAGLKAGCRTIMISGGRSERADFCASGLAAAAEWILVQEKEVE